MWGLKAPPGSLDKSFLSKDMSLGEEGCNTVAVVSLFGPKNIILPMLLSVLSLFRPFAVSK